MVFFTLILFLFLTLKWRHGDQFSHSIINQNRLHVLRYKLRAISKYNMYEKQIHQSFGKFISEFDILKCVVVDLLEITKSA